LFRTPSLSSSNENVAHIPDRGSPLLCRWWSVKTTRVIDRDGLCEHRELHQASLSIAYALRKRANPRAHERIALFAEPNRHFVSGLFGILDAGCVPVVLSPLYPETETAYFLQDADVQTIVADAHSLALSKAHTQCTSLLLEELSVRFFDLEAEAQLPIVLPSAPAMQLYTSGTTSRPKGAVLSHQNLSIQQEAVGAAWGFSSQDSLLHALPLHHMHGLCIALLTAIGAGATIHMQRFNANEIWESMKEKTVFMGVPTMYAKLFQCFDAADESARTRWTEHAKSLRLATSGSAALPVPLAERWQALTGVIPLERFGMTEIGVGITNPLVGARRAGTVGFPLPSVEIKVVDDEGRDCTEGALLVRGPSVFLGYHKQKKASEEAFVNGWFKTGDTVSVDADGRVRILGRSSIDILKSGGYKLSALEIEDVLRRAPGILDAAVIGLSDPVWGQRVVACLLIHPNEKGSPKDPRTLREFLKPHLAAYKIPKEFVILEEFPQNPMGKVIKASLLALIEAQRGSLPA
jgi:malonyl-CoA/methylmalonyl-CoA synthetase